MQRLLLPAPLIVALALGLVFAGLAPALAQDDADDESALPEGVSFEALGFGLATDLPQSADVVMLRYWFEPDAVFPIEASDPSTALVTMEEGELTIQVEDVPLTVVTIDGADIEAEEVDAGDDVTIEVGDSTLIPAGTTGEIRNEGEDVAVALITIIAPSEDEASDEDDDASEDGASDEDASEDSDDADGDSSTGEVKVTISDFAFEPAKLEIEAGTTVVWTNLDTAPHTASANNGIWDSDTLREGDTFSMTFDDPGTYEYGCIFHPSMEGSIVVN